MLARHFGSRRGFVLTYWHRILAGLGRYGAYRQVEWKAVDRLVFVCRGNICRSAYAEAVARSLGLNAVSCGLDTVEAAPANSDAAKAARKRGFSLEEHRTTPIMYLNLRKSDLLVAMEPWQTEFLDDNLVRKHQRTLLGLWGKPQRPHIQDPYGTSPAYFDKCFAYIEQSVDEISHKIKKTGS